MGRDAERLARTLERIHRRTHLREGRPRQPQGVQTCAVVDARGATPLLPAVGETVPRGEALRLSRASACRGWAGGPHHEPAGGRRQLGRQERVAQPPRTARGAHAPRVRMGVLHEDRAPAAESFIPNDPLEDGKATSPEPEGDVSPSYGIGVDWNEFHTGTRYPNGTD